MNNITNMIAEGKGKRLYATENPDEAVVYYRDETFAFHGLKRGRIIGKGRDQQPDLRIHVYPADPKRCAQPLYPAPR